ncbi:hypothetical protein LIX17_14585 [Mycobacterium avium subsp. hominissuis]|uniref:hypothetical protein n=1 Tax=Mycobacterium avium TaxID=1764 RepID=UPI0009FC26ED|nr:hypothetical protein [Mycobacterium avium]MBG0730015.1 hypothetical protein [Mycobacterium avium]MCA2338075.1 hypothetical protein [Mycobacterium avium]MCA4736831.1 hypothetical protein [Mycobacterium avium subsp. hominissuis]MCA4746075.1 hypothetical protein [Mycobacterium avium subsp. hominissuis]PBJ64519.1 hypothetical protein BB736_00490 [Mycobacterium avium subsp. hominissuis]
MTDTVSADRLIPDILRELGRQVSFDSGPLTMAQQGHVARALAAVTNGHPDVIFLDEHGDDVLYAIYWLKDSTFGVLNVMNIDQNYSGVPPTEGWVRPVSELSRIDLRVDLRPDQVLPSEVDIRLDATVNWRDGQTPVRLDGTFSGNHYARDAANALIRAVLNQVGATVDG